MGSYDRFNWEVNQSSLLGMDACPERVDRTACGQQTGSDAGFEGRPEVGIEAMRIVDEICRIIRRNPEAAWANASHLRALLSHPEPKSADSRGGLAPWQERKIDRYLREHLVNPPTVERLAEQVSLSVSHFFRAFKQSFGMPPRQRIIWLRLELAQRLMLTTEMPLSEIALACGLTDQTHLSKLFRRWLNDTPHRWRRRNLTDLKAVARRHSEI